MSLHVRAISEHAEYRYRARVTMGALILILVGSGLGLIPQENGAQLGIELIVATFAFLVFWAANAQTLWRRAGGVERATLLRSGIGVLVVAAGIVGESALTAGFRWGLTVAALGFLAVLPLLVFNAWALLVGVVEATVSESRQA
jgi:hypothetical protein